MAILEKIVKSEKAKSMQVKLSLGNDSWSRFNYQVLQTIMSESSCVGNLDLNDQNGDTFLELLPLLQEQPFPSTYYPCTSIHLTIRMEFLEQYREIFDSVQHWTPHVKKLFLLFAFYDNSSHPSFRTELIQAVRNNLHLQLVELDVENVMDDIDENTTNADEECRAWLERYCERNQKMQALDKADSIPLNVWPYVFHLASRCGADILYQHLRQNAGYMLTG